LPVFRTKMSQVHSERKQRKVIITFFLSFSRLLIFLLSQLSFRRLYLFTFPLENAQEGKGSNDSSISTPPPRSPSPPPFSPLAPVEDPDENVNDQPPPKDKCKPFILFLLSCSFLLYILFSFQITRTHSLIVAGLPLRKRIKSAGYTPSQPKQETHASSPPSPPSSPTLMLSTLASNHRLSNHNNNNNANNNNNNHNYGNNKSDHNDNSNRYVYRLSLTSF
jgi:hypothetical protein